MCFHNSVSVKMQKIAARFGRETDIVEIYKKILEENYHVSAFQKNPLCPIITADNEIQAFQWGLIPYWVRPKGDSTEAISEAVKLAEKISKGTRNARAETIFEKPSFRTPIKRHRCIIPSTGYFEHHHNEDGTTTPYFIFVPEAEIFSIAGIFDEWTDPKTGEIIRSFSMITTEANKLTGWIHNGGDNAHRMPVILKVEDEKTWLDPKLSEQNIKDLLYTFVADKMDAYAIKNDFIKKNPHDPSILDKAA